MLVQDWKEAPLEALLLNPSRIFRLGGLVPAPFERGGGQAARGGPRPEEPETYILKTIIFRKIPEVFRKIQNIGFY